jgi:CRP-like cAMP-binding protein
VRLAVLDRRISTIMGRWPELVSAIVGRAVRHSFELATNQATSHLTRVDARLELLFWGLADRWGRVGPDGVVLELPLTHQVLGRLVGAQRPSVTTALSDLARRGVIERRDDGAWVLRGDPPGQAEAPAAAAS